MRPLSDSPPPFWESGSLFAPPSFSPAEDFFSPHSLFLSCAPFFFRRSYPPPAFGQCAQGLPRVVGTPLIIGIDLVKKIVPPPLMGFFYGSWFFFPRGGIGGGWKVEKGLFFSPLPSVAPKTLPAMDMGLRTFLGWTAPPKSSIFPAVRVGFTAPEQFMTPFPFCPGTLSRGRRAFIRFICDTQFPPSGSANFSSPGEFFFFFPFFSPACFVARMRPFFSPPCRRGLFCGRDCLFFSGVIERRAFCLCSLPNPALLQLGFSPF